MGTYGVTDQGFIRKRQADCQAEIETDLQTQFGNFINLLPSSVFGQLVGLLSEREASIWESMEDVYNSQYPDTATGVSLDNVLSASGLTRLGESASYVPSGYQLLFGVVGTLVPAGTVFSVVGTPSSTFATIADVTLVAGADEVQQLAFSSVPASGAFTLTLNALTTASINYNAAAADIQAALRLLTGLSGVVVTGSFSAGFLIVFTGSAGKQNQTVLTVSTTGLIDSTGATVTPTVSTTTQGVPQGTVQVTATSAGPITAPSGTLTNIVTPVSGLTGTLNSEDATVGRNIETDAQARVRRDATLQVAGAGTPTAIRSKILSVANVTAAQVFENTSLIVDPSGRPPKSFETVVYNGDPAAIAAAIFASKPGGIATYGNQTSTVVDSQGTSQTVNWSRPTSVLIYLSLDLLTNSSFPTNGIATATALLLAYGNALGLGAPVIVYPTLVSILSTIPGILNITVRINRNAAVSTTVGAAAVNANIPIASNEISVWDTSRISINVTT